MLFSLYFVKAERKRYEKETEKYYSSLEKLLNMSSKKKEPQLQEVSFSLPDLSMWRTFCLVSGSGFIFRCHEAAKPGRLLWVSTGMPCSNSFPGLFEKEMCALLYRTSEVDHGCCSLWINPCCTTTSWHFLSYDELSHLLQNSVFVCVLWWNPVKLAHTLDPSTRGWLELLTSWLQGFVFFGTLIRQESVAPILIFSRLV